jgi:amidase
MTDLPRHHAFLPYPDRQVASASSGPLAGLTMAVKDIFDVAGYPTGAGNAYELARSGVKTATAGIVQTLLDAGASFVGKSYTDELAYSLLGQNVHFGCSANPAFPGFITGGSSSGSAVAVAAGLADLGLGTDTSGSIRIPAALTGTIGWRPTRGMLSLDRCRALAPSFDTAGFIVRDLDALARLMDIFGAAASIQPIQLCLAREMLEATDDEVVADCRTSLQKSGLQVETGELLKGFDLTELAEAFQTILRVEAWRSNAELLEERPEAIDPAIRERLAAGPTISMSRLEAARDLQRDLAVYLDTQLRDGRVYAFPTLPTTPPRVPALGEEASLFRQRVIALTCVAGLAGLPQLSLPLGRQSPTQAISLLAGKGLDRSLLVAAKGLIGGEHRRGESAGGARS